MKQLFNKKRGDEGFTLIEMMIVIAIIGILATIVIRSFAFLSTARDSKRISDIRTVQNYLELYYNANGSYPPDTSYDALAKDLQTSINVNVPMPANASFPYCYSISSTSTYNYILGTQLENPNALITSSTIPIGTACGSTLKCGQNNVYCVSPQ